MQNIKMFQKIKDSISKWYNNLSFVVKHKRNKAEKMQYGRLLKKDERLAVEYFNAGKIIKSEIL